MDRVAVITGGSRGIGAATAGASYAREKRARRVHGLSFIDLWE